MKIALIGNGIERSLVDYEEEIDFSQGNIERQIGYEKYNHGTVCAAIIAEYAHSSNLISLKAVEKTGNSCGVLNIKKVILLSHGSSNFLAAKASPRTFSRKGILRQFHLSLRKQAQKA